MFMKTLVYQFQQFRICRDQNGHLQIFRPWPPGRPSWHARQSTLEALHPSSSRTPLQTETLPFIATETISDTETDLGLEAFTLSVQKSTTVNTLTHSSIQNRYGSLSPVVNELLYLIWLPNFILDDLCFNLLNCEKKGLPRAALEAALATRGSTTDAKNATVDMIGLPLWLKGMGWCANGPGRYIF